MRKVRYLRAGLLTTERSLPECNNSNNSDLGINIVYLSDLLSECDRCIDHIWAAQKSTVPFELRPTLDDTCVLTFGHDHDPSLTTHPVVDVGTYTVNLLISILKSEHFYDTASKPFVLVLHNTRGPKMLAQFVHHFLFFLGTFPDFSGLASSFHGIVAVENPSLNFSSTTTSDNPTAQEAPRALERFLTFGVEAQNSEDVDNDFKVPVIIVLDETNHADNDLREYLGSICRLQLLFTSLNDQPYPYSTISRYKIFYETRKLLLNSLVPPILSAREPNLLGWVTPEEQLPHRPFTAAFRGTYGWLFNHRSYRDWISSDQDSILWVMGRPGCGKSVLTTFIADSIRRGHTTLTSRAVAAFISFDFRFEAAKTERNSRVSILQSILYQIMETYPGSWPDLHMWYPQDMEHLNQQRFEDEDRLLDVLAKAAQHTAIFIIIDALDECEPKLREDLMTCVKSIRDRMLDRNRVRFLISSRWTPAMKRIQREHRHQTIELDIENEQDIATYCSVLLSTNLYEIEAASWIKATKDGRKAEHQERLIALLIQRARGVFLWVRLTVEWLVTIVASHGTTNSSAIEYEDVIRDLPDDLEGLYEHHIEKLPPETKRVAQIVLLWCTYGLRPLTVDEVHAATRAALIFQDDQAEAFNKTSDPHIGNTCCNGLVEIVNDPYSHTAYVQFVHSSVKEFLSGTGAHHLMSAATAHTKLAAACFGFSSKSRSSKHTATDPDNALVDYSLSFWAQHARLGDAHGVAQDYLLEASQFSSNVPLPAPLDQHLLGEEASVWEPGSMSLVHLASKFGLLNTLKKIPSRIRKFTSWDQVDMNGETPLHLAARNGHIEVVRHLLSKGASVHATNKKRDTPLHFAVVDGNISMIRMLLEKGAIGDSANANNATPLHLAAQAGSLETVEMLLQNTEHRLYEDSDTQSPLVLATISRHERVAAALLRSKAIAWSTITIGTALVFAAAMGLAKLVELLLSTGRFLEPQEEVVERAFIAGIVSGAQEVVEAFIKYNVSPNIFDHQHGQSALSLASAGGWLEIVLLLLKNGADPNKPDISSGKLPAAHAVNHGHPEVVRALLAHGARIESEQGTATDSWAHRTLMMIKECPSGNRNTRQDHRMSSTECNVGSSSDPEGCEQPSESSRKRKRGHTTQDGQGVNSPRGGNEQNKNWNFACPFQKLFPIQHPCNPYRNISKLKEHLKRSHTKTFCIFCLQAFKDTEEIQGHVARTHTLGDIRGDLDSRDYSLGIRDSQAKAICKVFPQDMHPEQQWQSIFRIVFPKHPESDVPSPYYLDIDLAAAFGRISSNPILQQRLSERLVPDEANWVVGFIRDIPQLLGLESGGFEAALRALGSSSTTIAASNSHSRSNRTGAMNANGQTQMHAVNRGPQTSHENTTLPAPNSNFQSFGGARPSTLFIPNLARDTVTATYTDSGFASSNHLSSEAYQDSMTRTDPTASSTEDLSSGQYGSYDATNYAPLAQTQSLTLNSSDNSRITEGNANWSTGDQNWGQPPPEADGQIYVDEYDDIMFFNANESYNEDQS